MAGNSISKKVQLKNAPVILNSGQQKPDRVTTLELLLKVVSHQTENHPFYADGLVPSQRYNPVLSWKREDNNIFFTASIVFVLQNLADFVPEEEKLLIRDFIGKAIRTYPLYRNKNGLDTYSFWPTDGSPHFPNGLIFRHLHSARIPDDSDDTALVFLTSPQKRETTLWLKDKLIQHANLTRKQIRQTYPDYKNLKAYSTFFGTNMFIEFDFCVLTNILYWVFQNKLPVNQHDTDSIAFLRSVILNRRHLYHPFRVSHNYPNPVLILYHLARLIAAFDIPGLLDLKPVIIQDLTGLSKKEKGLMNRILISTSLMRLGYRPDFEPDLVTDEPRWTFFIAGMLTALDSALTNSVAHLKAVHLNYICEAHRQALRYENRVLSQILRS